ncbi:hypothetical protein [Klebsiella pneumoniae]|uniref:DinB/UmuC family translesion DNA polymerase n=1 Tax=Klebsiella pneumoniae TaxID=573 RepID=UPI003908B144
MVVSRSFGERVTSFQEMQMAITGFAARAGEKLRQEKQHCGVLGIFRPKTTKCSGGRAVRGLQRGITFR